MNADGSIDEAKHQAAIEGPSSEDTVMNEGSVGINDENLNNRSSVSISLDSLAEPQSAPEALLRPDDDLEHLKRRLDIVESNLDSERRQHAHTRSDLEKKRRELHEFRLRTEKERQRIDEEMAQYASQCEANEQQKDEELEDTRRRWKEAASSLNKFLAQGQGFSQITNSELIQKVNQLRFNIRNLTDQQFGGDGIEIKSYQWFWKFFAEYFEMPDASFEAAMKSPSKRPLVVAAFLWAFLKDDVFGNFRWAGTRVSNAMSQLTQIMEPFANDDSVSGPDGKRRVQTWRASTTALIVDAMDLDHGDDHGAHRKLNRSTVQDIVDCVSPFSKSKPKDLAEHLFSIVTDALDLDKMISKQAAEIVWIDDPTSESRHFAPDLMELRPGERHADEADRTVWLVLAPGMVKRGKSSGEDFAVESLLLKMEVSCEPATMEYNKESGDRAPGQSNVSWSRGLLTKAKPLRPDRADRWFRRREKPDLFA